MNDPRKDIGILIADPHRVHGARLRRILKAEPGYRVLGEARDGKQALEMARRLKPLILLLDVGIPRLSGSEILDRLKTLATPVHTLILTAALDRKQMVAALYWGARGILSTHAADKTVLESIRSVAADKYWVCCESVADRAQAILRVKPTPDEGKSRRDLDLTRPEKEIIALVEDGYTDKEIAQELTFSRSAVANHLTGIFEKLGVANRLELVLFSIDHRLAQTSGVKAT